MPGSDLDNHHLGSSLLAGCPFKNKGIVADCMPTLPLMCSKSLLHQFQRSRKLQFTARELEHIRGKER